MWTPRYQAAGQFAGCGGASEWEGFVANDRAGLLLTRATAWISGLAAPAGGPEVPVRHCRHVVFRLVAAVHGSSFEDAKI